VYRIKVTHRRSTLHNCNSKIQKWCDFHV